MKYFLKLTVECSRNYKHNLLHAFLLFPLKNFSLSPFSYVPIHLHIGHLRVTLWCFIFSIYYLPLWLFVSSMCVLILVGYSTSHIYIFLVLFLFLLNIMFYGMMQDQNSVRILNVISLKFSFVATFVLIHIDFFFLFPLPLHPFSVLFFFPFPFSPLLPFPFSFSLSSSLPHSCLGAWIRLRTLCLQGL